MHLDNSRLVTVVREVGNPFLEKVASCKMRTLGYLTASWSRHISTKKVHEAFSEGIGPVDDVSELNITFDGGKCPFKSSPDQHSRVSTLDLSP